MSTLIVAKFRNQFAAASAFDKLMSRGLSRRKGAVQCDESVGNSAASSSTPTTFVSPAIDQSEHKYDKWQLRSPDALPPAVEMGFSVLTIEIDDDGTLEEVRDVMRGLGAVDINILPGESLKEDDTSAWPEPAMGNRTDVDRAIRASQQGKPRIH
jgi:hypothetical protein